MKEKEKTPKKKAKWVHGKKMEEKTKRAQSEKTLLVGLVLLILTLLLTFTGALPTGPNSINITSNDTGQSLSAVMVNISGGYIAKLNITLASQNDRWKAFLGDINGAFTLDDASGSTIYDWTTASSGGEVYATRASSAIDWAAIDCANSTQIIAEDTALAHTGGDNISSTFSGAYTEAFVVAGITIDASDNCVSTNTYVDNVTQGTDFDEVILYDSTNSDIVFATILEDDKQGYDGNNYDFQMIVPENGSATWSGSTAYYLYVELG